MAQITTVPRFRVLTFDSMGVTKVAESSGKQGESPKVVTEWSQWGNGDADYRRSVLNASINNHQHDNLVAVARDYGLIEVFGAVYGDLRVSIRHNSKMQAADDVIAGVYLFRKERAETSSMTRSCTLLTWTTEGHVKVGYAEFPNSPKESTSYHTPTSWKVCAAGNIFCSKVHGTENYALFGGYGFKAKVWDLEKGAKIWKAKSKTPVKKADEIYTPTWFTCATFLDKDDHRQFVAGTNSHQVFRYDLSARNKKPVTSIKFGKTPIKALAEDKDGYTIYVGNGSGDLVSYDMRNTGTKLGSFKDTPPSGSIRSIVRHPNLPVIASCGADCYLRIWDVQSKQLLYADFLEEPLTDVVFDYIDESKKSESKKRKRNKTKGEKVAV